MPPPQRKGWLRMTRQVGALTWRELCYEEGNGVPLGQPLPVGAVATRLRLRRRRDKGAAT